MLKPSNKSILGTLSIIAFMFSAFLLFSLSGRAEFVIPFYSYLLLSVIYSFNIAIIFTFFAFGALAGAGVAATSLVIVLWAALKAGMGAYAVFTLSFFITAGMGFMCLRAKNRLDNLCSLEFEKLSEETNVLLNSIEEKKGNIRSLEKRLNRYLVLREVTESLSTRLSIDEINKLIVEKALSILGKKGRALLFLVDTEKQTLFLSESQGPLRVRTKTGDVFDHWVLRNRKSLIVEDVTTDFRFPAGNIQQSKNIFRSLIAAPLISEDKAVGIIRMDCVDECVFTQDDLRLLDIIANLGAVAIENSILYAKTEELAIRDAVTGLAVRRHFMERFKEEIKRAAIKKGPLSLLILDIDHFKNYNDTYGHAAGDLVLKHLARTISSMVNEGDIVARYGGEEMVILLCDRDKKEAQSEAEKLRKTIKSNPLTLRRHTANITVSIGVSSYPDDAIAEEELIRMADERLYKAKEQGRNRVCSN